MCCFAIDTGNHDSATVLVRYDTGMHQSYTQYFFARKLYAKRGWIFSGYKGTLEFDWYKNEIKIYMHHTGEVIVYQLEETKQNHFGGDINLLYNFIEIMNGSNTSIAPLESGLVSSLMCLKARESDQTGRFIKIEIL